MHWSYETYRLLNEARIEQWRLDARNAKLAAEAGRRAAPGGPPAGGWLRRLLRLGAPPRPRRGACERPCPAADGRTRA